MADKFYDKYLNDVGTKYQDVCLDCGEDEGYIMWLEFKLDKLQNTIHNKDHAKCEELLKVITNGEAIKASPAVTLYVIKEKLEKHFA